MKRKYRLSLTKKQIGAITLALFEYSQIEMVTETGLSIAKYYDDVRNSILRQLEKQEEVDEEREDYRHGERGCD